MEIGASAGSEAIGKKRASASVTAAGRRRKNPNSGECDGKSEEIPQESKETRSDEAADEQVLNGYEIRDID
jgi:hypothetical protein